MAILPLTFQYISASFQNLAQISGSGELFDGLGNQVNTLDVDNIVATNITSPTPSVTINTDLIVIGTLTAQQYVVSSSIINETTIKVSGSTKFGDSLDDVHEYTGSLSVTGSANFYGDVVITGSLTVTSSNTFINYGPTFLYGDVVITGTVSSSSTITGSLYGTASHASNSDLLNGKDSNVFATTGSNTFYGSQTIRSTYEFQLQATTTNPEDSACITTFSVVVNITSSNLLFTTNTSNAAAFIKYFLVSENNPSTKFRSGTLIMADGKSQGASGTGTISDIATAGIGDTSGFTFEFDNGSNINGIVSDGDSYRIYMEITRMEIPAI